MRTKMKTSLPKTVSENIKNGGKLAGDRLSIDELNKWYKEEEEACFESEKDTGKVDHWYKYIRLVNNRFFKKTTIFNSKSGKILFIGPADGIEAEKIAETCPDWTLYFIESSKEFQSILKSKFPNCQIVTPSIDGSIDAEDGLFDAVCAFSVLHHMANVSHTIHELYRVLKPQGFAFIREPCSSMGDWSKPRKATPNERGIPKTSMLDIAKTSGFKAVHDPIAVVFEPLNKIIIARFGGPNSLLIVLYVIDRFISGLLSFNDYYWRDTLLKKFGPSSYFFSFQK